MAPTLIIPQVKLNNKISFRDACDPVEVTLNQSVQVCRYLIYHTARDVEDDGLEHDNDSDADVYRTLVRSLCSRFSSPAVQSTCST